MGSVIGDLLPLAIGVAVSPVPIIAVILMLFTPNAGGTSFGFLVGWVVGIVAAAVVFLLVASQSSTGTTTEPSTFVSWVKLIIGLAALALAFRQWHGRPRPGQPATLPKWMSAIDHVTPAKATGLGFVLAALNPKNLAMCIAAGVAIAGGNLSGGGDTVAIAVFTVLACCTVAIPVIAYAVARDRMRGPLDELKTWLETNNAAVMTILLLVIGVLLFGKGLGGLF